MWKPLAGLRRSDRVAVIIAVTILLALTCLGMALVSFSMGRPLF